MKDAVIVVPVGEARTTRSEGTDNRHRGISRTKQDTARRGEDHSNRARFSARERIATEDERFQCHTKEDESKRDDQMPSRSTGVARSEVMDEETWRHDDVIVYTERGCNDETRQRGHKQQAREPDANRDPDARVATRDVGRCGVTSRHHHCQWYGTVMST